MSDHIDADPLSVLSSYGDLLEREIVAKAKGDTGLLKVLQPYALVWQDFILPKRVDGDVSRIKSEWTDFAARHYTAIIRVYNAWHHLKCIQRLCENDVCPTNAAVFLEVHDRTASFWWNLGSAVDNFTQSLPDSPVANLRQYGQSWFFNHLKYFDMKYFYDRRTQFIHKYIVPVMNDSGILLFNFFHLDNDVHGTENTAKSTDWEISTFRAELVTSFYQDAWNRFLDVMTPAWSHLWGLLKDSQGRSRYTTQISTYFVNHNSPIRMTAVSGETIRPDKIDGNCTS